MMLGISRRKMYKKKSGKSQMSRRRKMCRNFTKEVWKIRDVEEKKDL